MLPVIRIIDRYILAELTKPFLAGIGAFLVVMLSNQLYLYIGWIVEHGLSAALVGKLLLLALPAIAVITLPVGYMMATMLVLGRLSRDSEITALRSSGIGLGRVIAPMLLGALIVSYMAFELNERIVPWTNSETVRMQREILRKTPAPLVKPNLFFAGTNNRYFYVDRVDKDVLKDVLIFDLSRSGYPQVITANKAIWDKTRWMLYDGMVRKMSEKGYLNYEAKFKRLELSLDLSDNADYFGPKSVQEQSSGEAYEAIKRLQDQGQNVNGMMVDYHIKFSLPLATFFSSLLAVPLGLRVSRFGAFIGVAASIFVIFIWYVLYSFGRSLGAAGTVAPMIAAWNQNIIFGIIGAGLFLGINRR
jgi:LPS export ABC transporter permease LptF